MKIRTVLAISVAAAGLAVSPSIYAAPATIHVPVHAMFSKSKMIKFNLRNDSSSAMELKVGDTTMTIDAGKTVALKLAEGTRIVTTTSTPTHEAGALIAEVSSTLSDATVSVK